MKTSLYNIFSWIRFTFLFVAVLMIWALRTLNWIWMRPNRLEKCLRKQGLNGNSYRLTIGVTKESAMIIKEAASKPITFSHDISARVLPSVHNAIKRYGKNCFMWIGTAPRIHITDPTLAKDVFSKYDDFQKYYKTNNPLVKLFIGGVISYEGKKWAKHRSIMNPAFHLDRLKHMLPAFHSSCSDMIRKWEKMVPEMESFELDVWPQFEALTADVISRTAFGSSYGQGTNIFELLKEQSHLTLQAMDSAIYIPGSRFLPTKWNKRMKEIHEQVQASIRSMVNARVEEMMDGGETNEDLLGVLLRYNLKETQQNGVGMTVDDVIAESKLFYFAGQETTSGLLTWTMIVLSKHHEWQDRAREEIFQVFGDRKPDYEGLSRLKIVTMIINEVLRLYPPVVELTRIVREETKLGELTIPAGVSIMVPTILIHNDHEIWGEDACEFNPERFSEGVSKATKGQVTFFPFGWGPRICIAQNFALLEVKMALALILPRFCFDLSPSYAHAPYVVITLQPQFGAHLTIHKIKH
uniref:Cytochrome P450 n=1 Tax=Nothapodytes nimmoniana TaxID=159386 RepID=A0A7L7RBD0_NOTNI|nr:cytochrome P450 [Nothapodytes nimmoniana]